MMRKTTIAVLLTATLTANVCTVTYNPLTNKTTNTWDVIVSVDTNDTNACCPKTDKEEHDEMMEGIAIAVLDDFDSDEVVEFTEEDKVLAKDK